jgi:serine/threonine protein kinase
MSPTGKTWYSCLPSVAYSWAPGTLQEAISLGKRGNWKITKQFSLMKRLCGGLYKLHSEKMLHADLRPANIEYEGDPKVPTNYVLSDYGSFAETGACASERHPTGGTVLERPGPRLCSRASQVK